MQRVLITYAKFTDTAIEERILREAGLDVTMTGPLVTDELRELARSADALMVGIDRFDADLIAILDSCKIICRVGTGVDAIDIPAATEKGIWVTNIPDYSIDEVSSHAIALVMAQSRYLFPHRQLGRQGIWRYRGETPIRRLSNQTLGVIGLGRIGKASARKGIGLGMRVIACDPYIADEDFASVGAEKADFETVMRESDFITLHVPLNDETRKLIDARALSLMKPTAFLVNTARGEIVDVPALVEAVRAEVLAGAALDVLPIEPPDLDDPVLHEERIIVTPHIGWASTEAGIDSRVRGSEDVVRTLRGERPKYPLNEVREMLRVKS
jgi:D-3-phosphoglycerate dehydrogenase / 2-oxoglutarate reductase